MLIFLSDNNGLIKFFLSILCVLQEFPIKLSDILNIPEMRVIELIDHKVTKVLQMASHHLVSIR